MIRWFARNGVAANVLMLVIAVGGLVSMLSLKRELFPELVLDTIVVEVPYPGASPEEVEESICIRIEERIGDLEGIKKLTSQSKEGVGRVMVEVAYGYDTRILLDDIKVRVDAIDTFPEDAEEPVIEESLVSREVLTIAIYGDADEKTLRRLADHVREEVVQLPGITHAELAGVRNFEIAIEISEEALQRYGLTFSHVADAVRNSSVNVPGGVIKAEGGEVLLRSKNQAYTGEDFEYLVVIRQEDGARVTVGDVARVVDGFEDEPLTTLFNNKPAAMVRVFEVGDQNIIKISEAVTRYVESARTRLPQGVHLDVWRDSSVYLIGRLNLLVENGVIGLILVFGVLTLFLRPSLALWVSLGIPISFLGALLVMPLVDVSINIISLFGFILVLGIVVDDAIVVGESVFTQFQRCGSGVDTAIKGAEAVSVPVTFAVLTTAVAFTPLLTMPGFLGKLLQSLPWVVISTLLFSLIESKLILPYHLSLCKLDDSAARRTRFKWLQHQQSRVAVGLERFIERIYRPVLSWALVNRYLILSLFVGVMIVIGGLIVSGWVRFVFFPEVPSDYTLARVKMVTGTPASETRRVMDQMASALERLVAEFKEQGVEEVIQNVQFTVGARPFTGGPGAVDADGTASHIGEIAIELARSEDRKVSAPELAERWREYIGPLAGVEELEFQVDAAGTYGEPIDVQLTGADFEQLEKVAEAIKRRLGSYEGLFDIKDNYSTGKREVTLKIKPSAEVLGLSQIDLARQVRQAFYGEEAQRVQRGRDDIRVMVRYPKEQRRSLYSLENMRIRTPSAIEVPFSHVAEAELSRGSATITRIDRRRVINVIANADKNRTDLGAVKLDLRENVMPELLKHYPGVSWSFEGESREESESLSSLAQSTVFVLFVIYALMAIPFRSYTQPLIIMSIIPFGLIGAVLGHFLIMKPFSMLSLIGCLALTGVVVNDSLVLVDYINKQRQAGKSLLEAVCEAGAARFRPILLTSLTTFAGLTPILFERSLQAQFLIPMATSLAFGVLFATGITLFLVPCCYLILEDIRGGLLKVCQTLGLGRDVTLETIGQQRL